MKRKLGVTMTSLVISIAILLIIVTFAVNTGFENIQRAKNNFATTGLPNLVKCSKNQPKETANSAKSISQNHFKRSLLRHQ